MFYISKSEELRNIFQRTPFSQKAVSWDSKQFLGGIYQEQEIPTFLSEKNWRMCQEMGNPGTVGSRTAYTAALARVSRLNI